MNNFLAGRTSRANQRGLNGHRHHVKDHLSLGDSLFGVGQLLALLTARHANRGHVHQNRCAQVAYLRRPRVLVTLSQRPAGLLVTRDNHALRKTGIEEGTSHRSGHAARTAQQERQRRIHIVRAQQRGHRDHISVVRLQEAVGVYNRVHRTNHRSRVIHIVHQRDNSLLERHRHRTAANTQRTHTGDSALNIGGGHRLVQVIQPVLLVQVVVELDAVIRRAARQRNADGRITIQRRATHFRPRYRSRGCSRSASLPCCGSPGRPPRSGCRRCQP